MGHMLSPTSHAQSYAVCSELEEFIIYYMILPALAISTASEHTIHTSVQSCGFTCVSGSIRAIMEQRAALRVKGHTWQAALKVNGAHIQRYFSSFYRCLTKLGAVYSATLCYYCLL